MRFIGENIRLDPINLHHLSSTDALLSFFMGKNTSARQKFIIGNLRVEKDLIEALGSLGRLTSLPVETAILSAGNSVT